MDYESVPYPEFGRATKIGERYPLYEFGYADFCPECKRAWIVSVFFYEGRCPLHWDENVWDELKLVDPEWEPHVWRYRDETVWRLLPSDDFTLWVETTRYGVAGQTREDT